MCVAWHRPEAPLLTKSHAIVPSARVAFVGDFIEDDDVAAGTVESAALSGMRAADALMREMDELGGSCSS